MRVVVNIARPDKRVKKVKLAIKISHQRRINRQSFNKINKHKKSLLCECHHIYTCLIGLNDDCMTY